MESASQTLKEVLEPLELSEAKAPVYANFNAQPYTQAAAKELLVDQVKSPVRWQETVERLCGLGVDTFIECGPGKTLCGLIRKTVKGVTVLNVQDEETLKAAVEAEGPGLKARKPRGGSLDSCCKETAVPSFLRKKKQKSRPDALPKRGRAGGQ